MAFSIQKQCAEQQGKFVSFAQAAAVLIPVFVLLFSITVIFSSRIRGLGRSLAYEMMVNVTKHMKQRKMSLKGLGTYNGTLWYNKCYHYNSLYYLPTLSPFSN